MDSPLGAQALTPERGHKCEIGRLAREVRQVAYVGQATYGQEAHLNRYRGDFFWGFQGAESLIAGVVSTALRGSAFDAGLVSKNRRSNMEDLFLGLDNFKNSGQTRELQDLKNRPCHAKEHKPLLGVLRLLEDLYQ